MVKGALWVTAILLAVFGVGILIDGAVLGGLLLIVFAGVFAPPVRPHVPFFGSRPFGSLSVAWVILFFAILAVAPTPPDTAEISTPHATPYLHAMPYFVVSEEDTSFATRERRAYYITLRNPATNREELAHTVMQAALDKQERTGADVVSVFLEPDQAISGKGYNVARVHFIPDGLGFSGSDSGKVWNVTAVAQLPKAIDVAFWVTWYALRSQYADENDLVTGANDKALRAKVLEQIGAAEPYSIWFPIHEAFNLIPAT